MSRKPYNPATAGPQAQVHDRRAKDIGRGAAGHIVETEIDNPCGAGAKISAVRSIRDDPLADRLARGHIDQAQYLAGREFQKHWGMAERGPRSPPNRRGDEQPPQHEGVTDSRPRGLGPCYAKCCASSGPTVGESLNDIPEFTP